MGIYLFVNLFFPRNLRELGTIILRASCSLLGVTTGSGALVEKTQEKVKELHEIDGIFVLQCAS